MTMNSTAKKQERLQANSAVHTVNTRNENQLNTPTANISGFQKSAYYADIKDFNSLAYRLISLMNKKNNIQSYTVQIFNYALLLLLINF
jgi:hypothetical protein